MQSLSRQVVLLEEGRQYAVGIEGITALVGTIESRLAHGVEQISHFLGGEDTCRKDSHLSFKHLVERFYRDGIAAKGNEVIGVVESIEALVDRDRLVEILLYLTEERDEKVAVYLHFVARMTGVDALTIGLSCSAHSVNELATRLVGEVDVTVVVLHHSGCDIAQEEHDFGRDRVCLIGIGV